MYPCHNVDQNNLIFVIVVYNSVEEMSVALDNGVIEGILTQLQLAALSYLSSLLLSPLKEDRSGHH